MTEHSRQLPPTRDIPQFHSEDEEAAYWSQHDSTAIMAATAGVSDAPPADLRAGSGRQGSRAKKRPGREPMKLISLYLPEDLIDAVKSLAARDEVAYQALIRSWIGERLHQEAQQAQRIYVADPPHGHADVDAMQRESERLLAALQHAGQTLADEPGSIGAALATLLNAKQHEMRVQQHEAHLLEALYAALIPETTSSQSGIDRLRLRADDEAMPDIGPLQAGAAEGVRR